MALWKWYCLDHANAGTTCDSEREANIASIQHLLDVNHYPIRRRPVHTYPVNDAKVHDDAGPTTTS